MTLRLNQKSELRVLGRNQIECVEGTIWCKTADEPSEIQVPIANTKTNEFPSGELSSALLAPVFRCSESVEVQWSISNDETACTTIGPQKAVLQSSVLSCVIEPGQNMSFSNESVHKSSDDPASNRIRNKLWQIPLLYQSESMEPELAELLESALSFVGQSKVAISYDNDIRALGAAGAIPLLAYVADSRSKEGSSGSRTRAMMIACEMADARAIPRLKELQSDTDSMIGSFASSTLQRLLDQSD